VIPVLDPDTPAGPTLPALLVGIEWEQYTKTAIQESALRTAVRVGQLLQEDLVRIFRTDWDHRQWWLTGVVLILDSDLRQREQPSVVGEALIR